MGVGPGYSSRSRHCGGNCAEANNLRSELGSVRTQLEQASQQININPDPTRWHIIKNEIVNGHLIVEVLYPNCTNYEGMKLMMFAPGVTVQDLVDQRVVDPHFAAHTVPRHPIARFEPTPHGWSLARKAAS